MPKLGLLTLASHPTRRSGAGVGPADEDRSDPAGDAGSPRLRKIGLLTYESDRPYRAGHDAVPSRRGETGPGRAGRVTLRKVGLLTLS